MFLIFLYLALCPGKVMAGLILIDTDVNISLSSDFPLSLANGRHQQGMRGGKKEKQVYFFYFFTASVSVFALAGSLGLPCSVCVCVFFCLSFFVSLSLSLSL